MQIALSTSLAVKIGDFGATRELENNHPELGERTCKTPAGTPMYMSPQQVRRQAYGQKADCWSLGCLLYELLTLRHAFYGYSLEQLFISKITKSHCSILHASPHS
jgi:NIMA (never in mitosis gene a)-related kinase